MHLWRPHSGWLVIGCKNVTRALMNADITSPGKETIEKSHAPDMHTKSQ